MDVAGERGATHGAVGTVGVAPQRDRPAGAGGDGVDDGGDVVEVPFDRVAGGVAAGAETSAIHGERGEVVAEDVDERVERGVVGDRAVDHDERRSGALDPYGDRCPVGRSNVEPGRASRSLCLLLLTAIFPSAGCGRWSPVEFGGEHRDGVGEGVGLLGVRDVAAVVDLDEPGVGQRGGQPVGDRPERRVAGVAGQDQDRDRDGRQFGGVTSSDGERRSVKPISALSR